MTLAVVVGLFALGYLAYYFSPSTGMFKALATRLGGDDGAREAGIHLQRAIGFVTLGVIPGMAALASGYGPADLGLVWPDKESSLVWYLGYLAAGFVMTAARPGKHINTGFYPQVRAAEWTPRRVVVNTLSWCLYLVGYEAAFRGFMLFPLVPVMGPYLAVALNSGLYAFAHVYKGPGEAFGAFFLGIALCMVALGTGSFVIPLAFHVVLALGNDYRAVAANPDMRFVRGSGRSS